MVNVVALIEVKVFYRRILLLRKPLNWILNEIN
jgi:hypothetical protein